MDKVQTAVTTFNNNFNCSQAVFSAFSEELGLDRATTLKIASCFGGGMQCGEVCGAVTGALMAIGLKYGQSLPDDIKSKENANAKAREFIAKFKAKNQTILCKELLGYYVSLPEDM
jgi:C_GCAxxG_C_C family probable redox protein